jgi:hypothetical protein
MSKPKYFDDDNDVDFVDNDNNEDSDEEVVNEEVESEDDFDEDNRLKMKEAYDKYIIRLNEEMKTINVNNKMQSINNNKQSKKKDNKKNVLSLDKFILEEKKIENLNKPKKFISKRVEDKMKTKNIPTIEYKKREFNPRKPPFNLVVVENKITNPLNDDDFPSL